MLFQETNLKPVIDIEYILCFYFFSLQQETISMTVHLVSLHATRYMAATKSERSSSAPPSIASPF